MNSKIFKLIASGLCIIYLTSPCTAKEFWLITPSKPQNHGFFSCFDLVLGHLYLYENKSFRRVSGIKVDFGKKGLYYSPEHGPNWWEYYFEPLSLGFKEKARTLPSSKRANELAWSTRYTLNRTEASELLHRHVKIKPQILSKVVQFTDAHFSGYMIGIHYRGTDKCYEAPKVPYEKVLSALLEQIELLDNQPFSIFVATDEQAFLNYMESLFPGLVVSTDSTRSEDSSNIHAGSANPYLIGEEAIIDAILLSKCDLLIRTSSNLSLWSTYYNKDLPTILLNTRFNFSTE